MTFHSKKAFSDASRSDFQAIIPDTSQKVSVSATSAQSAVLTKSIIRVTCTQDCHLAFGANPTAVADGTGVFLPAGAVEYFGIPSTGLKLAAIRDSADGTLFITQGK